MNATVTIDSLFNERKTLIELKPILEADFTRATTQEEKYNAVQRLMKLNYEITCVNDRINRLAAQGSKKTPFWKILFQK